MLELLANLRTTLTGKNNSEVSAPSYISISIKSRRERERERDSIRHPNGLLPSPILSFRLQDSRPAELDRPRRPDVHCFRFIYSDRGPHNAITPQGPSHKSSRAMATPERSHHSHRNGSRHLGGQRTPNSYELDTAHYPRLRDCWLSRCAATSDGHCSTSAFSQAWPPWCLWLSSLAPRTSLDYFGIGEWCPWVCVGSGQQNCSILRRAGGGLCCLCGGIAVGLAGTKVLSTKAANDRRGGEEWAREYGRWSRRRS